MHIEIEAVAKSNILEKVGTCCRAKTLYCLSMCAGVTEEVYCKFFRNGMLEFPEACKKLLEDKNETGKFYKFYSIACTKLKMRHVVNYDTHVFICFS